MSSQPKAVSLKLLKIFHSYRLDITIMQTFSIMMDKLQPDNCVEITPLDVPFSKKKLDVALKRLKKLNIIQDTDRLYVFRFNPEYVMYDTSKLAVYKLERVQ